MRKANSPRTPSDGVTPKLDEVWVVCKMCATPNKAAAKKCRVCRYPMDSFQRWSEAFKSAPEFANLQEPVFLVSTTKGGTTAAEVFALIEAVYTALFFAYVGPRVVGGLVDELLAWGVLAVVILLLLATDVTYIVHPRTLAFNRESIRMTYKGGTTDIPYSKVEKVRYTPGGRGVGPMTSFRPVGQDKFIPASSTVFGGIPKHKLGFTLHIWLVCKVVAAKRPD